MINIDRMVPVQATDLLSLYGTILKAAGTTLTKASASNAEGDFAIAEAPGSGSVICDEPVKSIALAAGVSAITIYFVPTVDFKGITRATTPVTESGVVDKNPGTLYLATLSSNTVTYNKVGF